MHRWLTRRLPYETPDNVKLVLESLIQSNYQTRDDRLISIGRPMSPRERAVRRPGGMVLVQRHQSSGSRLCAVLPQYSTPLLP
jgi:hypothetical protein